MKLIAGAILLIGIAAVLPSQTSDTHSSRRYEIVFSPPSDPITTTYLLDTETGKTWRKILYTSLPTTPEAWQPMVKPDTQADLDSWAATQR